MRKRKTPEERKTPFSVTASAIERTSIDNAARAAGLPRSVFIVRVVGDYIAFQNRQLSVADSQEAA